jgi:hypothetical protein
MPRDTYISVGVLLSDLHEKDSRWWVSGGDGGALFCVGCYEEPKEWPLSSSIVHKEDCLIKRILGKLND